MLFRSFRSLAVVSLMVVGGLLLPSSLRAQNSPVSQRDSVQRSAQAALGPSIAPAGVTRLTTVNTADSQRLADERVHAGSDVALMGAGAAALLVGLVIGGDGGTLLAIGGSVVGLVGLYRYLK